MTELESMISNIEKSLMKAKKENKNNLVSILEDRLAELRNELTQGNGDFSPSKKMEVK